MATFLPSTNPASFRPCRKGSTVYAKPAAGVLLRNPTTGIAVCCARAATGHAAAAPPNSVMNSRRFIRSPRRRGRASSADFQAKRPGGRKIDDELEFDRLHDRQVGWLGTFENTTRIVAELPIYLRQARSVAHQAADLRVVAHIINGWKRMARRQRGELDLPAVEERVGCNHERVGLVADKRREG